MVPISARVSVVMRLSSLFASFSASRMGSGLTDLPPALDRVFPGDRLEQHHAGTIGVKLIGGTDGEQRHLAPPRTDNAHLASGGHAFERDGAVGTRRHRR